MRWEDERYVRVYVRDTADWLALSWDAQSLLMHILRKVDRAGLLPLGRHGKRAVAISVGAPHLWAERIAPALEELLADGCVVIEGNTLLVPNFIEAQETPQSDRQRKAESRARAQARVRLASESVTERDESSRNVTERHGTSEQVTAGHSVPCRAGPYRAVPDQKQQVEPGEPAATAPRFLGPENCARDGCGHQARRHALSAPYACLAVEDNGVGDEECPCNAYEPPPTVPTRRAPLAPDEPLVPPARGASSAAEKPEAAPAAQGERRAPAESKPARKRKAPAGEPAPEVLRVFGHWQEQLGHPRAVLDAKRRGVIEARLAEGIAVEHLLRAVDGCAGSDWHRGANDRRTPYDDLTLILRDAEHVDRFARMPPPAGPVEPPPPTALGAGPTGTPAGDAWAGVLGHLLAEGYRVSADALREGLRPVALEDGVLVLEARDRWALAQASPGGIYADALDEGGRAMELGVRVRPAPEAAQAVAS